MSKLEWIIGLSLAASGMSVLFFGSVFFYWGAWNYLTGTSDPPGIESVFVFWGGCIIIGGIYISSYLGKKLKGKYLVAISLMHLIAAPSLIYVIFSLLDPHYVHIFMPPIILSNIALDVGFIVGYIKKRLVSNKMK